MPNCPRGRITSKMAVILHFQSTGTIPGNAQPFRMTGASMTAGRSDQNDLVLPDPDKVISGRHCAIEDHGGNIVVIDFSTNGTFLNYNKAALGPTPTPLNDGDILSIGTYELQVEISAAKPAGVSSQPAPHSAGAPHMMDILDDASGGDDFLDDLLGPSAPIEGHQSVIRDQIGDDGLMPPMDDDDLMEPRHDENQGQGASISEHSSSLEDVISTPAPATSAIPDDWDLGDLSPSAGAPSAAHLDPFAEGPISPPTPDIPVVPLAAEEIPVETPSPVVAQPRVEISLSAQPEPSPSIPSGAGGGDRAARAFLKALGEGDLSCADSDLEETMERLGTVMRTMILGVREILMTRATIKSEFRINQTMISAGGNNPLKFSVSPEQAIESMVKPTTKGYMDSVAASEQALTDIKVHEVATMTGMEAALKGVLAKMDPNSLIKLIESDRGFRSPLTSKKARYWDGFEHKYQEIVDQAENDFQDLFSNEFAKAYQDQLDRLK